MMAKYRKRPVVVEAEQYTEYGKLVQGMCNSLSCYSSGNNQPHAHTIHDGQIVLLEVGDYVIPEPDGKHFYPIKPDIFAATYEPADTPSEVERLTALVEKMKGVIHNLVSHINEITCPCPSGFGLKDLEGCKGGYTCKAHDCWQVALDTANV